MDGQNPLLQFEPGLMIWTIVVFFFTLLVLRKIAWGPLLKALDEREQRIQDALSQAEKANKEAEAAIAKAREESAAALRKSEETLKQAKLEGQQLRERMVEEAKAESQKVVDQGLRRVEAEQRAALQQVRREAADLAVQAAAKLIRSSMNADEQRRLVEDFLREAPQARVQ
ncbi:MAG: F0F1 ATP synthase subunit B [Acidobacteria bacterium]|nr:F0F1 ATP synthase subunit B [Acidobacteriota bacterium]